MELDANLVIESMKKQIADLSVKYAYAEAQSVQLKKENDLLKEELQAKKMKGDK